MQLQAAGEGKGSAPRDGWLFRAGDGRAKAAAPVIQVERVALQSNVRLQGQSRLVEPFELVGGFTVLQL
jgi:hypothetical protein